MIIVIIVVVVVVASGSLIGILYNYYQLKLLFKKKKY